MYILKTSSLFTNMTKDFRNKELFILQSVKYLFSKFCEAKDSLLNKLKMDMFFYCAKKTTCFFVFNLGSGKSTLAK